MSNEGLLPTNREMLPDAQKRGTELWETVDEFKFAGFILSNGELLEGLTGEHLEIASSILPDEENPVLAFLSTGAIRIANNLSQYPLNIELVSEPSFEQIQTLRRGIKEFQGLNIDVTASTGELLESYSRTLSNGIGFGDLVNNIRRVIRMNKAH